MDPKTFADQMRQARLNSPLQTREQALKQFAEVEAYLQRHSLQPKSKPSDASLRSGGSTKSAKG